MNKVQGDTSEETEPDVLINEGQVETGLETCWLGVFKALLAVYTDFYKKGELKFGG